MITHYRNWLTKDGTTQKVLRKKFIEFVTDENNKTKIFKSKDGSQYLCAIYLCSTKDGDELLKFRIQYDASESGNDVGWNYTKAEDSIRDTVPDYLTCTPEIYKSGFVGADYEPPGLLHEVRKKYNLILILEELVKKERLSHLKPLIELKLKYLLEPSRETSTTLREFRKKHPDLDDDMSRILVDKLLFI